MQPPVSKLYNRSGATAPAPQGRRRKHHSYAIGPDKRRRCHPPEHLTATSRPGFPPNKGNGPRAFDAKPRLSMSGFTKACVRRQRDDFRVRKSGCKRVANPRAPAGAIREAIAPGRYNAASLPKGQSTGYLDTIQNKAAVALPTPMSAGEPRRPAKGLPKSGIYFNDVRVRSFIPNGAPLHYRTGNDRSRRYCA